MIRLKQRLSGSRFYVAWIAMNLSNDLTKNFRDIVHAVKVDYTGAMLSIRTGDLEGALSTTLIDALKQHAQTSILAVVAMTRDGSIDHVKVFKGLSVVGHSFDGLTYHESETPEHNLDIRFKSYTTLVDIEGQTIEADNLHKHLTTLVWSDI